MIAVLCGGVGGSRFLRALASVFDPANITAIINTGDDDEFHGLYVSPDPDIVTYALAGEIDEERGWGLRDDTFRWLEHMSRLGHETWFQIGDRDLATHLHRTQMLANGATLSETMVSIRDAFGVRSTLLPMSDDRVRTLVETEAGPLPFQRYLVQRRAQDAVHAVRFEGTDAATPAPGVLEALRTAEAIFIAPSNPIASIGPILAVPAISEAVRAVAVPRIAVSPIISGESLQPPAAEMMSGLGHGVSVVGVANVYAGLIDALIIDEADASSLPDVAATGARPIVSRTLMRDPASAREFALAALEAAGILPA
jgi:LPPG:FO 2-phospho-L-lactate transferase